MNGEVSEMIELAVLWFSLAAHVESLFQVVNAQRLSYWQLDLEQYN